MDSEKAVHICLSGDNILEEHCHFENTDGKVTLHTLSDAITVRPYLPFIPGPYVIVYIQFLNGKQISAEQVRLSHNDRITRLNDMFSLTSFVPASASFLVSPLVAEVNYLKSSCDRRTPCFSV